MKRFVLVMLALLLVGGITYSQSDKTKKKKETPQEKVIVNKEFDENGNLIRFDSSYVYSWSSDSTFAGSPGDMDFSDFFNWKGSFFGNDSAFSIDPFDRLGNSNFEDFFKQFSKSFSDSIGNDAYSFRNDSIHRFFGDSTHVFHFKDHMLRSDFLKQFNDSSVINFFDEPELFFKDDSIHSKFRKMMEKQMQELEELQKNFF